MGCSCDEVRIVRGNSATLRLALKADDVPITTLSGVVSCRFVALDTSGAPVIDKGIADGILFDTPDVGTVSVPLTALDTDVPEGTYDIAFEATWGAGSVLEWNFARPLLIAHGLIP